MKTGFNYMLGTFDIIGGVACAIGGVYLTFDLQPERGWYYIGAGVWLILNGMAHFYP